MCQTPAVPAADGKMRASSTHTQVSVYQNAVFPSRRGRLYYILYASVYYYYYLVVVLMYTNADNDRMLQWYIIWYTLLCIYVYYHEDEILIYKSNL